ncbi:unnamed protein product [Closterium sp. NIES-53]
MESANLLSSLFSLCRSAAFLAVVSSHSAIFSFIFSPIACVASNLFSASNRNFLNFPTFSSHSSTCEVEGEGRRGGGEGGRGWGNDRAANVGLARALHMLKGQVRSSLIIPGGPS